MVKSKAFGGRVIFDHLPKTAGQAVNAWLRSELGDGCVTTNLIGEHRALIHRYGGDYSVISAHVHFNREGLDPRYQYITCLREPIDRAVSWLFFVTQNHSQDQLPDWWLEACRFLETEGDEQGTSFTSTLQNPYVEHLAAISGAAQMSSEKKLAAALEAIEQFDVWGLYEDMPGFMNGVATLLGLNAPQALPRVNLTKSRPAVQGISDKLRSCLESLNALDIALYRELCVRYAAREKFVQHTSFETPWRTYNQPPERHFVSSDFNLLSAELTGASKVDRGQVLNFNIEFSLLAPLSELEIGIHVFDEDRRWAFGTNSTLLDKKVLQVKRGTHRVHYCLVVDLPEGSYTAGFAFAEPGMPEPRELAWFDKLVDFSVAVPRPQASVGYTSMPVAVNCWQVSDTVKGLIEDFAGTVFISEQSASVMVNEVFYMSCLVENASSQLWTGSAESPIRLSYHWLDVNGQVIVFSGERTDFPEAELSAGNVLEVNLKVLAPNVAGCHRLVVTPLVDGLYWFDEHGFKSTMIPVNVLTEDKI